MGQGQIPDGSLPVKLALVKSCHKGLTVLLPGTPPPLLLSPQRKVPALGQAGSPQSPLWQGHGEVCVSLGPWAGEGMEGLIALGLALPFLGHL